MNNPAPSVIERVSARSGFVRPSDVIDDTERPGLRRARAPVYGALEDTLDIRELTAHDWRAPSAPTLDLGTMGFDCIDVSARHKLLESLEAVRQANYLSEENRRIIRRQMLGKRFRLSNGKRLRFLFVASEGTILRKSGPNGLDVTAEETLTDTNGHVAAAAMHGDQDVYGTPVKQMLKGWAPRLFRHTTPDGANKRSPIFLLNVWLPLQQITQPLSMLDRRTLNSRQHQLRYALPTDSFLEREEDRQVNDIWALLYDEQQQWYFAAELGVGQAYVFDTLGEPHGALTLSGEAVAEQCYVQLRKALQAVQRRDVDAVMSAVTFDPMPLPSDTTVPLREAIARMRALLEEARKNASLEWLEESHWRDRAERAMDAVVRKSIEMRAVALVY